MALVVPDEAQLEALAQEMGRDTGSASHDDRCNDQNLTKAVLDKLQKQAQVC